MSDPIDISTGRERFLENAGWIRSRDGTWGLPNSTCRNMRTGTAYYIGKVLESIDNEEPTP